MKPYILAPLFITLLLLSGCRDRSQLSPVTEKIQSVYYADHQDASRSYILVGKTGVEYFVMGDLYPKIKVGHSYLITPRFSDSGQYVMVQSAEEKP